MKRILRHTIPALLAVVTACGTHTRAGAHDPAAATGAGEREDVAGQHEHAAADRDAAHDAAAHDTAAHAVAAREAREARSHAAGHDAGHAAAGHELPATAGPGYTVADVRFMQSMMLHHAQALLMAELAPGRGAGIQLQRLAQKIDISQRDEIDMMRLWLTDRGQVAPDTDHAHAMDMPGMVTEAQLALLEAARGRDFERLFLTLMIHHHEGALEMVDALFASPGAAQDSDIFRFATDVAADQLDEIGVMQYMLELLDHPSGS